MPVRAENISKRYFRTTGGANWFYAVCPMSMDIEAGCLCALTGRSGSGKTTLLNMLAGIMPPSEGKVFLDGTEMYSLPDRELSRLRNKNIAVVPQGRSAIDTLTVLENILLPAALYSRELPEKAALSIMERFQIAHLAGAMPRELSGGELRRMAIARALLQDPSALFADEPTADLDDENTRLVLSELQRFAHDKNRAVLLVSHENEALYYSDRAFRMDGGNISEISLAHDNV